MSTSAHQNKSRLVLLLAIAAALFGFGLYLERLDPGPEMPALPLLEPSGRAVWSATVAEGAGMGIDAEELEAAAETVLEAIEGRLSELSERASGSTDWRAVYRELQADSPTSGEELLATYREEIDRSRAFLSELDLVPLPAQNVEVAEATNPAIQDAFSMAFYMAGRLGVVLGGDETESKDEASIHCFACIPPLVVHETFPGHHIAFSSTGQKRLSGDPADYFFHEGWALYAEVIMLEADYYGTVEREMAAWRNLLLRTLRAQLDPLLHRRAISEEQAVARYRERAMLSQQAAETEVRGHLRKPGVKASYFVGLLQILELRERSSKLPRAASVDELHQRILQTSDTWPTIARRELGIEIETLEVSSLLRVISTLEPARMTQTGS